ncbi:MAG: leucine-rich repeat domain-containing protein [Prevotella sp.]|nr:leucine-rich repeat domain-containing protein [Prevotella sp.]
MKKLFLLFIMAAFATVGAKADIRLLSTSINGESGYGIYDWETEEDLEQFLAGTYEGTVYVDGQLVTNASALLTLGSAAAIKVGGDNHEPVSSLALSRFTAFSSAKYIDSDKATLGEGASVSSLRSNAQYIALPNGADIQSIKQMATGGGNPNLKAAASTNSVSSPTAFVGYATEAGKIDELCKLGMLGSFSEYGAPNSITSLTIGGNVDDRDFGTSGNNADYQNVGVSNKGTAGSFATWSTTPPAIDLSEAHLANEADLASINSNTASIVLPKDLTEIKAKTFYQFSKLTDMVVPNSVETIGDEAFVGCGELKRFTFGNGIESVGTDVFSLCSKLETLVFTPGIESMDFGERAFAGLPGLKHVVLPEGVKNLGDELFYQCTALESIRLPQSLETIGNRCFEECSALTQITIPENVRRIGQSAFTNCSGLTDVYVTGTTVIPEIWCAPHDINNQDEPSTFTRNHLINAMSDPHTQSAFQFTPTGTGEGTTALTWDEAALQYEKDGSHAIRLHYPEGYENVYDDPTITANYGVTTSDNLKLPTLDHGDYDARYAAADVTGAEEGHGCYTSTGWKQFALQKAFAPEGGEVFKKKYDDTWYTMCFPWDLTDEQLEEAFNAEYNICEFTAARIVKGVNDEDALVLYFTEVATSVGRSEKFGGSSSYKSPSYDGTGNTLALAGHPYMIHPNLGLRLGQPQVVCYLTGLKENANANTTAKLGTTYHHEVANVDIDNFVTLPLVDWRSGSAGAELGKMTFIGSFDEQRVIPENYFFLGLKAGTDYPKYYRETSSDATRTTGLWSQYSACVKPGAVSDPEPSSGNNSTWNWIEENIYDMSSSGSAKGMDVIFDDVSDIVDATAINQIVDDARSNGLEVKHIPVVYNINGQVVQTGDIHLNGLPKGIYIVNGKKFFVK